ncbi:MAG: ParB/RepB/Spo0J family partition protein [Tissierellia bacterium]|nr:ParB/RepB/Spo0J family partition protein [Tissierellia bacterium]
MAKKNALGRGLNSLFQDGPVVREAKEKDATSKEYLMVDPEKIRANPNQPRKDFDPEALKELAQSLQDVGVLQPLLVQPEGDGYFLIAGERRLRAAKLAGLEEVPVRLYEGSQEEAEKLALVENIQREDLGPMEESRAYHSLKDRYGYSQEELGKLLGKSRSYIANTLRLSNLAPEVQKLLQDGHINVSQAKVLLGIKDPKRQVREAQKLVKSAATVRQTESALSKGSGKRTKRKDPYDLALEEQMMEELGTKVEISRRGKKGTLTLDFYSDDQLSQIIGLLIGDENFE